MTRRRAATALTFVALAGVLTVGAPAASTFADVPAVQPEADGAAYACRQDVHEHDRQLPGEYVHVASITQAPNGDLLYAWVGGAGEYDPATKRTWMSRLRAGESSWGPVELLHHEPGKAGGNPVIWHDGAGRVFLFFSTLQGSGWTQADLSYITSDDSGYTWSAPTKMRTQQGWNFGTAPVRMSNGEVLVPVYDERFGSSGFYVSDDGFQTWRSYPGTPAGPEVELLGHPAAATWPQGIQAATVELEPGHLLAYMRNSNVLLQTESTDYGRTWSPSTESQHPNPDARVALLKLSSGNLLLASNPVDDAAPERSPMRVALSEDGGQTWPYSVDVETNRDERYQYPYLAESADGMIHLGYTHARRTKNMRHVVFNEAFVREGPDIVSSPPTGKRLYVEGVPIPIERREYRDGAFTEVAACGYAVVPPTPLTSALDYVGDVTLRGNDARLAAALTREGGTPIAGREVTFSVAGRNVTALTDATGVAATTVRLTGAGPFPVGSSFAGDRWFAPASDQITMRRQRGG